MKNKCKEWLDKVIDNAQERSALEHFNENIALCIGVRDLIQIYSGIFEIAESVGAIVTEKTGHAEKYPYEYVFIYRGFQVSQLSEERIFSNGKSD